jgi:hypothetical protein
VNDHARSMAGRRDQPPGEAARQMVLRRPEDDDADTAEANVGNGADHPAVVAESQALIETLSVGEAVMRLDLMHLQVLMFRNSGSAQLNVVYRRGDGHVGWIDPGEA